jgi:hypothetical protein
LTRSVDTDQRFSLPIGAEPRADPQMDAKGQVVRALDEAALRMALAPANHRCAQE